MYLYCEITFIIILTLNVISNVLIKYLCFCMLVNTKKCT